MCEHEVCVCVQVLVCVNVCLFVCAHKCVCVHDPQIPYGRCGLKEDRWAISHSSKGRLKIKDLFWNLYDFIKIDSTRDETTPVLTQLSNRKFCSVLDAETAHSSVTLLDHSVAILMWTCLWVIVLATVQWLQSLCWRCGPFSWWQSSAVSDCTSRAFWNNTFTANDLLYYISLYYIISGMCLHVTIFSCYILL